MDDKLYNSSSSAPQYLSSRSADVILSEIRPTRLKSDALIFINAFLDELLWLILNSARSLAPQRLKAGLLRVLPTPLGKEALLEAELELRAYSERTAPTSPQPTDEQTLQDFPLQAAFDVSQVYAFPLSQQILPTALETQVSILRNSQRH